MQNKRVKTQTQMTLAPSLDALVPRSHWLYRLNQVLDLRFVHELVRPCYCQDNGRPSIDPEVIVRLFLLQAITGIGSVRALLQEVNLHLGYRWFIGYGLDEPLPDHSTLSKVLDRFGDRVFDALFARSIAQCQASGLISGRIIHVDATTIRADLDKDRVNQQTSPDPDARFGRFPGNKKEPGYKQHTAVDDASRVVLAIDVTPANVNEGHELGTVLAQAQQQAGQVPEVVCADSAYASGENAHACERQGIQLVSPPPRPRNHHSRSQFTIEQFTYDESADAFVCPQGKRLVNTGRMSGKKQRFKYRASERDCRVCPVKGQCTKGPSRYLNAGVHHAALVRLRADSQTEGFAQLYRRRSSVVEGVFAEAKQWHGLRRAWRRGLAKVRGQCLLIAAVLNFKRLAARIAGCAPVPPLRLSERALLRRLLKRMVHRLRHILGYVAPTRVRCYTC
jgi:transposase